VNAPAERRSQNIFDILRDRVRAASDGVLAVAASLGVLGLLVLGLFRRWPWAAVAACGVLLGAGIWGILDRSEEPPSLRGHALPGPLVVATRLIAGIVGLVSLLALLLGAFGMCLGTWIS
jgi:hypothetical protein